MRKRSSGGSKRDGNDLVCSRLGSMVMRVLNWKGEIDAEIENVDIWER